MEQYWLHDLTSIPWPPKSHRHHLCLVPYMRRQCTISTLNPLLFISVEHRCVFAFLSASIKDAHFLLNSYLDGRYFGFFGSFTRRPSSFAACYSKYNYCTYRVIIPSD